MRMRPMMIALLTCCMGLMTSAQADDIGHIDLYESLGFNVPCENATQPTTCDASGVTTMNAGTCFIYVCKSDTNQCPTVYGACSEGETRTETTDATGCPVVTCTKPVVCQTIEQMTCPTGQIAVDSGNKDDASCPVFSCEIDPNAAIPDGVCSTPAADGSCPICESAPTTCAAGEELVKGDIKNGCQVMSCEACASTNADGTCRDEANSCPEIKQDLVCPAGLKKVMSKDSNSCDLLMCARVTRGTEKNDALSGDAGNDVMWGSAGQDKIFGGTGNNIVGGGAGNDIVGTGQGVGGIGYGGEGNDTLYGGGGGKTLYGGAGNDTIYSGATASVMHGGEGNDTFYVKAAGSTIVTGSGNNSVYLGNMSAGTVSVNGMSVEKTSTGSLLVGGTAMTPDANGMVKMSDGTMVYGAGWAK